LHTIRHSSVIIFTETYAVDIPSEQAARGIELPVGMCTKLQEDEEEKGGGGEEEEEEESCEILGFRRLIVEAFTKLGRYMANVDSWVPTFWESLSVSLSGFKHSKQNAGNGWMRYVGDGVGGDSLSGKDGTENLSRNVGHNYQHTQQNVSEERRPQEESSYSLMV